MLEVRQIIQKSANVKMAMIDACSGDITKGVQLMIEAVKVLSRWEKKWKNIG